MIDVSELAPALSDPILSSMTFLNEVAERHPNAISLAAGRPDETRFDASALATYIERYRDYLRVERGLDDARIARTLFQYGPTKGIIPEVIAANLAVDEGITVDPQAIVVTVGCQEAMYLVLKALGAAGGDVVMAMSPTYAGLTGAAQIAGIPVWPVEGFGPSALRAAALQARAAGRRPRGCYVMADCANPSGVTMDLAARKAVLEVAHGENLLLLEDNPYSLFRETDARVPTLKALDMHGDVIYLGSYAKTVFPGARIGFAVADQPVTAGGQDVGTLADQLAKVKSMVTVNTPPLAQAAVAGFLLAHGYSLRTANAPTAALYRALRRRLLDGLRQRFPAGSGVTWHEPDGGFFVVLTVPFVADDAALEACAANFGVLWTPMHHFRDGATAVRSLRLSCSAVSPDQIDFALDRFADFVHSRCPVR